ncbi:uncharacterized protein LOC128548571 [Mercenaria mercenaria]|uniref:uncharacterized protein LOC128548571 n=1 Tax=Mercenaria mercenaria TaxID=6596 RepID=UPI00234E9039|nr:uncharacterized protein LOC128548571 [Mercenaria mercenaria]
MFLDDGIGGHREFIKALELSQSVKVSLLKFGFMLAEEKCKWLPAMVSCWLGHVLDFERNMLCVSDERIHSLECSIDSVLFQIYKDRFSVVPVRVLAAVVGQIISLHSVLGKAVSLRTKYLYGCILARASWNSPVQVTKQAILELQYWRKNARNLNSAGRSFKQVEYIDAYLFSDANAFAYGGYIQKFEPNVDVKKMSSSLIKRVLPEVSICDDVSKMGSIMPSDASSCQFMLPEVSKCPVTLPEVSKSIFTLPEESRCSVMIPEVSRCSVMLPKVGKCHVTLPEVSKCSVMLPEVSSCPVLLPQVSKCSGFT